MSKMGSVHWLEKRGDKYIVYILVQPNSSRTEAIGLFGDPARLKIKLASPPVDGAANEELVRFLKKKWKPFARQIEILHGHSSRSKIVSFENTTLTPDELSKQILLGN